MSLSRSDIDLALRLADAAGEAIRPGSVKRLRPN